MTLGSKHVFMFLSNNLQLRSRPAVDGRSGTRNIMDLGWDHPGMANSVIVFPPQSSPKFAVPPCSPRVFGTNHSWGKKWAVTTFILVKHWDGWLQSIWSAHLGCKAICLICHDENQSHFDAFSWLMLILQNLLWQHFDIQFAWIAE